MFKKIFICGFMSMISVVCASASASSSDVNIDLLSLKIFPKIDNYLSSSKQLPHVQKVGSLAFYSNDSDYFTNDSLLYSKVHTELREEALLQSEAIARHQADYDAVQEFLETADIVGKLLDSTTGLAGLDAKSAAYTLWDYTLRPLLLTSLKIPHKDGIITTSSPKSAIVDIVERLFKSTIDIYFINKDVKTSTAGLKPLINETLLSKIGLVMVWYDAALSSIDLVATVRAIIKVDATAAEIKLNGLKMNFIIDYVDKYNSNLQQMKIGLLRKSRLTNTQKFDYRSNVRDFWGLWWIYLTVEGGMEEYQAKIINGLGQLSTSTTPEFEKIVRAAHHVSELINNYGKNGLYSLKLDPKLVLKDGKYVYELIKTTNMVRTGLVGDSFI